MSRPARMGLVLGLGTVALVGLFRWRAVSRLQPPVTPQTQDSGMASPDAPGEHPTDPPVQVSAPLDSEPMRTAAEVLSEYWGDQWDAVRQRLEAAGKSLDEPFEFVPWEEVEHLAEERLQLPEAMFDALHQTSYRNWPETLDEAWIQARYQVSQELTAHDLVEIERLAEPYNMDIAEWSLQYASGLQEAIRHEVALGRYQRAPYSTASLATGERKSFFSHGAGLGGGWGVAVSVSYEDFPELKTLADRMHLRVGQRDATVRSWLVERGR